MFSHTLSSLLSLLACHHPACVHTQWRSRLVLPSLLLLQPQLHASLPCHPCFLLSDPSTLLFTPAPPSHTQLRRGGLKECGCTRFLPVCLCACPVCLWLSVRPARELRTCGVHARVCDQVRLSARSQGLSVTECPRRDRVTVAPEPWTRESN